MGRFDRYMLLQLLTLFGFFSLILVMIYWINRAVSLFDRLIADGQSAWVFLELTSLSLPGIIRIVLPLSAFVAAVYVTNRMSSESELTVVQATGYSPFRLARPVVYFGLIVGALMSILTHVLVPLSTERLILRQAEISQNMTARLLTPGEFLTPTSNVTFYIGEVSPNGEMLDIFISEASSPTQRSTYTATRAYLVRTDNGPQLVMVNGLTQTLDLETNRLLTTEFEDFAYDVGGLIGEISTRSTSVNGLSTWALFNPTPEIIAATNRSAYSLQLMGHDRVAQAALGLVAGLLGFSALVVGGFSRFGLWRYIALAVGLVILLKALESTGSGIARGNEALWPFMYLAGISGAAISMGLLYIAARPYFFKRRPKAVANGVTT
ncbi:LPS export ABC transporter permease LptF [Octadecabacter ascidiaceicola]|uniref:Putative permease YjgP/YjgQ family protein n=1 Tax=Octadecabacter ascidiaceicola TaxID=1655543 RepID=A0A238JNW0_9RHOB|nr:LPS export ABC transporter permease LptF [Octadecabacter ascidiaceicola]SMX31884.1 putative permease YjgP/YjgQ family protein [Octadecabacter ascidiaceicola]